MLELQFILRHEVILANELRPCTVEITNKAVMAASVPIPIIKREIPRIVSFPY